MSQQIKKINELQLGVHHTSLHVLWFPFSPSHHINASKAQKVKPKNISVDKFQFTVQTLCANIILFVEGGF